MRAPPPQLRGAWRSPRLTRAASAPSSLPLSGVLDAAKELEKLGKRQAEAAARLEQLQKKVAQATYQERTPEDIKQTGAPRPATAGGCRAQAALYARRCGFSGGPISYPRSLPRCAARARRLRRHQCLCLHDTWLGGGTSGLPACPPCGCAPTAGCMLRPAAPCLHSAAPLGDCFRSGGPVPQRPGTRTPASPCKPVRQPLPTAIPAPITSPRLLPAFTSPPPSPCFADLERLVKLEAELESIKHHVADMQKLLEASA